MITTTRCNVELLVGVKALQERTPETGFNTIEQNARDWVQQPQTGRINMGHDEYNNHPAGFAEKQNEVKLLEEQREALFAESETSQRANHRLEEELISAKKQLKQRSKELQQVVGRSQGPHFVGGGGGVSGARAGVDNSKACSNNQKNATRSTSQKAEKSSSGGLMANFAVLDSLSIFGGSSGSSSSGRSNYAKGGRGGSSSGVTGLQTEREEQRVNGLNLERKILEAQTAVAQKEQRLQRFTAAAELERERFRKRLRRHFPVVEPTCGGRGSMTPSTKMTSAEDTSSSSSAEVSVSTVARVTCLWAKHLRRLLEFFEQTTLEMLGASRMPGREKSRLVQRIARNKNALFTAVELLAECLMTQHLSTDAFFAAATLCTPEQEAVLQIWNAEPKPSPRAPSDLNVHRAQYFSIASPTKESQKTAGRVQNFMAVRPPKILNFTKSPGGDHGGTGGPSDHDRESDSFHVQVSEDLLQGRHLRAEVLAADYRQELKRLGVERFFPRLLSPTAGGGVEDITNSISTYGELREKQTALQSRQRSLEIELETLKQTVASQEAEVARLKDELSESRNVMDPREDDAGFHSEDERDLVWKSHKDKRLQDKPVHKHVAVRKLEDQLTNRDMLVDQLEGAIAWADKRTEDLQKVAQKYHAQIQDLSDERETMRDIIERKVAECEELKSSVVETKRSYEDQISVLSEHLCALDLKLSQARSGSGR
eukprot:g1552.t1